MITTVDSNLAKYDLENSLDSSRKEPGLEHQIAGIHERYRAAPLDRQTLKAISHNASPDFGACALNSEASRNSSGKCISSNMRPFF